MQEKTPLRAITFDAAGTLMRVAEPVGQTYARFAHHLGTTLSPQALGAGLRDVFPTMPPMAFPDTDEAALLRAERAWWRELVARVVQHAGGVAAFDEYFDALFAHYAGGAAWCAYPEAHGVLESARRRGLRVGVISNFDSRLPPILRELGLESLLDTLVYSARCGAAKPDGRIFRHALETLGVTPETALHVGDSLDADYHGASAAGMTAVHLHRRGEPVGGNIPTVKHLGELDAYLD
jgi:putative hydrolase of the HAD superfamily